MDNQKEIDDVNSKDKNLPHLCGRGRLIVRTIAGNRKIKRKKKLNDMLSLFSKLVLYTNSKKNPNIWTL